MENKNLTKNLFILVITIVIPILAGAQTKIRVMSSADNNPIRDVSVFDSAPKELGQTDKYGDCLVPSDYTGTITLRAEGYIKNIVEIQPNKHQTVYLIPLIGNEEVSYLYGTTSKKYVTGAISFISGDDTANTPGTNRLNSLSGKVSGLNVYQQNGMPGNESVTSAQNALRVRGLHTFGSFRAPRVLVDGKFDDYNNIDPNDIEKITVLKDAVANAMYGNHGNNGIVQLDTNRGSYGEF